MEFIRNKMAAEITMRLNALTMNTVVSGFMEYTNKLIEEAKREQGISKECLNTLIILLAPFAPHLAEELWRELGNVSSVFAESWPKWDEKTLKQDTVEIAVQINGKLRGSIPVASGEDKSLVLEKAKESVAARLAGKTIVKEIYVPGKIVNIVIK